MERKAVSESCRKEREPETLTPGALGLAAPFSSAHQARDRSAESRREVREPKKEREKMSSATNPGAATSRVAHARPLSTPAQGGMSSATLESRDPSFALYSPAALDSPDPQATLMAAAEITGLDRTFDSLLQIVRARSKVDAPPCEEQMERIEALRRQYYQSYANVFEEFFGTERAVEVLVSLQREPVQRFLAARRAMAPELAKRLEELESQMGAMEV